MENIIWNQVLGREMIAEQIKKTLKDFEANKTQLLYKRGIYIYGAPGSGKTEFVLSILKELDYDVVKYDTGDIRNKSIIDNITKNNMADRSIISLFHKKVRHIAILMDEIDGMNNGDKGGINTLIKLIRPKKNKKQRLEDVTYNPIICISNYHVDKKIKELMKICTTFELKTPNDRQMSVILKQLMPNIDTTNMVTFLQGDLRKLSSMHSIYKNHNSILKNDLIQSIFTQKSYNDDTKEITKKLINKQYSMEEHLTIMNETDRTIVGLLWHENIIDVIEKMPKAVSVPFYLKLLDNICFADYMDRITFQKQIWQFNEMTSLIKTFHCNKIYHETFKKKYKFNPTEVRFTKVLTKYSTEYNNSVFIQGLCQLFGLDEKDLFSFFLDMRINHENDLYAMMETYEISKLDINRIYRYIDKYTIDNSNDDGDDGNGNEEDVYVNEEVYGND
jgi:DNA polymerase III delta prime subunit